MVAPVVAAGARVVGGAAGRKRLAGAAANLPSSSKGEPRIGTFAAFFMIALAVVIDAFQFFITFIPVFGAAINLYATFLAASIFGLWFHLQGVSYLEGRKAGAKVVTAMSGIVAELIPIVSALPALTISVILLIWVSRLEDRTQPAAPATRPTNSVARFMPQKIPPPRAANDAGPAEEAA